MPNAAITATAAARDAGHALADIEAALVARFCAEHGLAPQPHTLLATLTSPTPARHGADAALDGIGQLALDDLVMAFETLVPTEEAKKFGAVFTPEAITAFMAREALDEAARRGVELASATVVDPAVGCGALLVAALRDLVPRTGEAPHRVAARLYGSDISAGSVARARTLLALTCLYLGDPVEPDLSATLQVADALSCDWGQVFGRDVFQVVLGNPPYIRFQQLDPSQRADLVERFASCGKGNFNLYFPFFEVAHRLADPAGSSVAFITPNAFLSSLSGGPLRTWMVETGFADDVVDFGHHRVFEALTYTAVTFATRHPARTASSLRYTTVAGLDGLARLPAGWRASESVVSPYAKLSGAPWRLVGRSAAKAVTAMTAGAALDTVADVRFGVATCRDKLYLLDGRRDSDGNFVKTYAGVTYRVEPGLARPCARVSSLADQAALDADRTRIIYPYELTVAASSTEASTTDASTTDASTTDASTTDASSADVGSTPSGPVAGAAQVMVLSEETLAERFPGGYAYLCAVRPELALRDKGRKTYPAWFAYARTQGLTPSGDKLLTPLYAARPRFLRDGRDGALFINGCSVTVRPDAPDWVDLDLLATVLNSGVCHYFVESTANAIDGGFFAYQKSQLGRFSLVPSLAGLAGELAALPPGERDDALAQLYGVTLPPSYRRT
jgi:adenine-specific DNA-methyltransferase